MTGGLPPPDALLSRPSHAREEERDVQAGARPRRRLALPERADRHRPARHAVHPARRAAPQGAGRGFNPIKAASVALVANTAPVAFGAIAIPIVTLAGLTNLPKEDLGAMVGRQTPFLALFVPLILVGMVGGRRGVKAVWPAALVGGVAFAAGQFACSNYVSVELTDIVASLLSIVAMVAFLRVWQPSEPLRGERFGRPAIAGAAVHDPAHEAAVRRREGTGRDRRGDVIAAYAPYLIVIVVFALAQWGPIK